MVFSLDVRGKASDGHPMLDFFKKGFNININTKIKIMKQSHDVFSQRFKGKKTPHKKEKSAATNALILK
jgi:hypothetical protein